MRHSLKSVFIRCTVCYGRVCRLGIRSNKIGERSQIYRSTSKDNEDEEEEEKETEDEDERQEEGLKTEDPGQISR